MMSNILFYLIFSYTFYCVKVKYLPSTLSLTFKNLKYSLRKIYIKRVSQHNLPHDYH